MYFYNAPSHVFSKTSYILLLYLSYTDDIVYFHCFSVLFLCINYVRIYIVYFHCFSVLFLCINYVRELHNVSSTSDHSHHPRFLYRDSRSTLVRLNASIFDNLPHEYCHQPDKSNVGLEG